MTRWDAELTVLAQVRKLLRDSGFVRAQFGGGGQIAALRAVLDAEAARFGGGPAGWFFPTAEEYAALLAGAGLTPGRAGWVRLRQQRRSFPTAASLAGYLHSQVFGGYDAALPPEAVAPFRAAAQRRALAELRRPDGTYDQDFVRLDLLAVPG